MFGVFYLSLLVHFCFEHLWESPCSYSMLLHLSPAHHKDGSWLQVGRNLLEHGLIVATPLIIISPVFVEVRATYSTAVHIYNCIH